MNITTIGIDLAKTSFSLVGADKYGKILLRKTVSRGKLLSFIAQCPPCMIGLEACSGAHYWAREFEKLGPRFASLRSSSSNHTAKAARMTTTMPKPSVKPSDDRISGMFR